jgi:hypothetical protein
VPRKPQQRTFTVTVPFGDPDPWSQAFDEAIRERRGGDLQRCSVVFQLDESWEAEIGLAEQGGAPVVERVEIRHDRWQGAYEDPQSPGNVVFPPLPTGGLPLRLIRSLTFGEALAAARTSLAVASDTSLNLHGFSRETLDEPRRPGRRGHSDRYYAEMSAAYVRAVERGSSRPVEEVADEWGDGYSVAYIRSALHRARRRGLLTEMRRGVAGGTLTAKARAVLGS